MRAAARFALSAGLLLAGAARAQAPSQGAELPLDETGSALTIPAGFVSLPPAQRAGAGVRAGYTREGVGVLLVVNSPGQFTRETLDEGSRSALRSADGFAFADRVERFPVLGFTVEGLRGEGSVDEQHRVVRIAVPLPFAGSPAVLSATGELGAERALRSAVDATLASARGRASIARPWQRALARVADVGLTLAVPLSALYALLAAVLFRRDDRRFRLARGLALTAAGLGWFAVGAWASTSRQTGVIGLGILLVTLGVSLVGHGAGMARGATTKAPTPSQ